MTYVVNRTFAVLAAGAGVFSMLQSLIGPVLPTIQQELDTSQNTATWVLTAYLLSAAVFTPILGRVGDMFGKGRTLVAVLVTLAVGCLVAALAPTIGVLIVARVIQGAGGAVLPLAFGIIRDEFPPERVVSAVGTMSAILAAGSGVGMVLAGPIVATLGLRWLFWLPLVVVLAAALAAHRFVPASPVRTPGRINWLAAALLSGWLVALLLAVSEAPAWGWASPGVLSLLALAVLGFATWVLVELRSANPLIDMRVLRLPAVWTTNAAALLFGAAMFSVWAFLPQFVEAPVSTGYGFGASVSQAGLLMLPMLVAMFAAGLVSGRLPVSARAQLGAGAAFIALGTAMLAVAHAQPWEVALAALVIGVGIGLAFSAMTNLIVHAVPASQTGAASGMNANIRTIGGSMGAAAMSSVVTAHAGPTGLPLESGYTNGFAMFAVVALGAVGATLLIPRTRRLVADPVPTAA